MEWKINKKARELEDRGYKDIWKLYHKTIPIWNEKEELADRPVILAKCKNGWVGYYIQMSKCAKKRWLNNYNLIELRKL